MKFPEKMSYGNIKSRKKAGIYPLRRKYSFGKYRKYSGKVKSTPPPSIFRTNELFLVDKLSFAIKRKFYRYSLTVKNKNYSSTWSKLEIANKSEIGK